jgi:hypothetical protein
MDISPDTFDMFAALALGFALAGLLASGFEFVLRRPLSLALLQAGDVGALATVPVLVFSAPLIILRGVLSVPKNQRRSFSAVFGATIVASIWSLLSGRLVLNAAQILNGA